MNLAEFNNEFDLAYNNAKSGEAPGLDMFEKSLFLTQGQEAIIIETARSLEVNEEAREILRNLIVNETITYDSALTTSLITIKLDSNSKFIELPSNVWYILTEHLDTNIDVIPKTRDEYNVQKRNPFKKASSTLAWRIDTFDSVTSTPKNIREIIYPDSFEKYVVSYLKKPTPIILEDLTGGDTIEGLAVETTCKLSDRIHRKIIDKAVEFAIVAYKEPSLQNNVIIKK